MDYTTLPLAPAEGGKNLLSEDRPLVTSLYHTLQALPDPRRGQGNSFDLLSQPGGTEVYYCSHSLSGTSTKRI